MKSYNSQILLPFNFTKHLKLKSRLVNWIPIVDLCVIACLFGFLRSETIFSPGIPINLPQNAYYSDSGIATGSVLTVTKTNDQLVILFDRNIFNGLKEWEQHLATLPQIPKGTLLVKSDSITRIQELMDICSIAERFQFEKILIAADKQK
jgi:biopolymer transport protein ExbD